MSRKRLVAWGLLLALTLAVRAAVAAPHAATQELRAAACCIEHCPPAQRLPMQAQRCCGHGSDARDPGTLSPAPQPPEPHALVTWLVPPPAVHASAGAATLTPLAMPTGPPPYRRTGKLQR